MKKLQPKGIPLLIGSLPLEDHERALDMVFEYSPFVPSWVQLPKLKYEGMISQFMSSLPGYKLESQREYIDNLSSSFQEELILFYEEYMAVESGDKDIESSRFVLDEQRARGFYHLVERLKNMGDTKNIFAIKGQITGPITFATAVKDSEGRAIFYDLQLRDMAIKHLKLLAAYQAKIFSRFGKPVIIFLDEPALAGFGSSEFISISREDVLSAFTEIISYLHNMDVKVGIHVCANTDWSLVFDSGADILSFDAYSYFDKLLLFKEGLKSFVENEKLIAWGIVPTDGRFIENESFENIYTKFITQLEEGEKVLNLPKEKLIDQIFITPSCGAGSLSESLAEKVLKITKRLYEENL